MKMCPCGSQKRYMDCCGLYIQTKTAAPTPEALMRSRYSAFVEGNIPYIRKTMRGPALVGFNNNRFQKTVVWLGLEVIAASLDPEDANMGYVEFKAKCKPTPYKEIEILHEKSKFEKLDGKWFYIGTDSQ